MTRCQARASGRDGWPIRRMRSGRRQGADHDATRQVGPASGLVADGHASSRRAIVAASLDNGHGKTACSGANLTCESTRCAR